RDPDGIWSRYDYRQVATPEGFAADPDLVHRFYNDRRAQLSCVEPNAAHFALARLEKEHTGSVLVITQNIDDLHERAGTTRLLHMHGELNAAKCNACGVQVPTTEILSQQISCHVCASLGTMRQD